MQSMKYRAVMLLVGLAVALAGCSESAEAREARQKLSEAANAVAKWTEAEWNKFASSSNERLTELRKDVNELGDEAKQRLGSLWQALQDKATAAKSKIQGLSDKSKDAWGAAKDDIENAIADLEKALREAKEKLGK